MPSPSPDRPGAIRRIGLRLEVDAATSCTTVARADGTEVSTTTHVAYAPTPHGLCRWTDPVDGRHYVIGSGALGGAAHFVAGVDGPADRMETEISILPLTRGDVVRATKGDLASLHLGLVSGPWRVDRAPGVELLSRQALDRAGDVQRLLAETSLALAWLRDWFGTTAPVPWGEVYTQVLVPDAPWLAMEHPGCVLLSERLLDARPGRSVAVLAHEAAHQWVGNRVSPLRWRDIGVFEGLAEMLGQMACEALLGPRASGDLARRRATGMLVRPPTRVDLRDIPATAGLPEVAGPVQHAELFRRVAAEIGAREFRSRICATMEGAGGPCSAEDLWRGLRVEPRHVRTLRLPPLHTDVSASWRDLIEHLRGTDPASAALAAGRAFRRHPPGAERVRDALAVVSDVTTPYPVTAGLAAELSPARLKLSAMG